MGLRGPGAKPKNKGAILSPKLRKTLPWERKGLSRVERVVAFIEDMPVTQGTLAGTKMQMRDWQIEQFIEPIFAEDAEGKRRVRTAALSMGRKNGKTGISASLALCFLVGPEAEDRGEVYFCAMDKARIADFSETISRGAFAASLASGRDTLALVDHDPHRVLARTKSGTLRLSEDERGLRFEIDVPSTTAGNDVLALAQRGDLGGMSFGFTVNDGGEHWNGDKRELRAVTLHEVSVVQSFPAYDGTTVSARARQNRTAAARRIALLEMEAPHVAL